MVRWPQPDIYHNTCMYMQVAGIPRHLSSFHTLTESTSSLVLLLRPLFNPSLLPTPHGLSPLDQSSEAHPTTVR